MYIRTRARAYVCLYKDILYIYPLNLEPIFKWVGSRIPGYRGQGGDKPGSSRKPGYFHKCLLVIQMRPKSHIGIEALVLDTSTLEHFACKVCSPGDLMSY